MTSTNTVAPPPNPTPPTLPTPAHPTSATPSTTSSTTGRANFKFTAEQKTLMLQKFNAGLHYPTTAEKEQFAEAFGSSMESVPPVVRHLT
jgi:hypothetical protein